MELLIFAVLAIFVYAITKAKDADMQAKDEETPAPEWARIVFVLAVAALLFACFGTGIISLGK